MKLNPHSFSKVSIITLVLCLLSPGVYARSTTLIEPDPVTLICNLSEKNMKTGIRNGSAMRGWVIVNQTPGYTELTYVKGDYKHSLTVGVSYTANIFAITYKDSTNLDYSVGQRGTRLIHRNAVGWMKNLSADIQMNANGQCFE